MTDEEEKKSGRDAYWRAREAADAQREGTPAPEDGSDSSPAGGPAYGPDEAEPDTTTAADYPSEATRSPPTAPPLLALQTSAAAPAQRPLKQRLSELDDAVAMLEGKQKQLPGDLSDSSLAAARGRDQRQSQSDRFSDAIYAAGMRKPVQFLDRGPGEADQLQARRGELEQQNRGSQALRLGLLKAAGSGADKAPTPITPYQEAELKRQKDEDARKAGDKSQALSDRKRTMLSLYPDHKAEIDALTDLGDAQTLQTALEGRLGRTETQTHSDQAAVTASDRSFQNALKLKEWERTHQNLTAEQKAQLEGIEKSDSAIDTFEGGMGSTSTFAGKLGASSPKIAGALGAPGADFQSLREGTAIALARGLEGGMARPGNVEIIQHMLPEASDSEVTKRQKLAHVREFVKNNRDAFQAAAEQTGAVMKPMAPAAPRAAEQPPPKPATRPAGVPEGAKHINGKWMWRRPDGEVAVVEG